MNYLEEDLPIELPLVDSSIIKVIGVGGGGNAVNHMYRQGIKDVSFVVCNTDYQALANSPVPIKIQIGTLGAGGKPEVAREAAEKNIDKIKDVLKDNTEMVFITATMGGGTGTGASPVVAKAAREMGILTIGIVTIPFAFELKPKIEQALQGVLALSEHVDALLVINNEKLREIYPELNFSTAYAKADDVLTNAAKGIAEIITVPGYINIDFADVYSTMKDGKVAVMNTGFASGESRITKAIEDALNSPLLNMSDVKGARRILLNLYCSNQHEFRMEEFEEIHQFMSKIGDADVIWGVTFDDTLGENIKITLIATGFDVSDIPGMPAKEKSELSPVQNDTVIEFTVNGDVVAVEENAEKKKDDLIKKAMDEFYGDKIEPEKEQEIEIEPENNDLPVFTLEDLEDDNKREDIENIPAWKRQK